MAGFTLMVFGGGFCGNVSDNTGEDGVTRGDTGDSVFYLCMDVYSYIYSVVLH